MPSSEERPSITNPYTTSTPPTPATPATTSSSRQPPISHWRQIFPKYAFEHPPRRLTPEHPPGVPSVTTPSTTHPTPPSPYGDPSQPPRLSTLDSTQLVAPLDRVDEPEALRRNRLFFYRAAVGTCVAIPVVALIPPRKLDLWTFGLGVTFFLTAGFAVEQKTGKGLMWHIGRSIPTQRNRDRWKERRFEPVSVDGGSSASERFERGNAQTKKSSNWEGVWKDGSSSKDAWIIEREAKERRVFEEGEGYGALIMDQIREVFGLKSGDGDDEDGD